MASDNNPVKVKILDKEFLVACPEGEREALLRSAQYLNDRMREIRDAGKVVGIDRVAVMAALNISHELLQMESNRDGVLALVEDRVRTMDQRVAGVLKDD